ncbi:MAG: glycosyltransferase [Calditrichaeota bacterium]|nr:glycosyltransferase [Calditrichota bacterium]
MDLSIVIPAFDESGKITRDVEAAAAFLKGENLSGEIIVVDDGSRDDTAAAAKETNIPPDVHLNVIRCDPHRGKGYAVRTGMAASHGEYVMFADSGGCVPYENALRGLDMLKSGVCELAHGSRKLRESSIQRRQAWYRRILSRVFRWVVIRAMKLPAGLTDTQCGFKMYRGDVARTLYGACITDGFMFDVEIIMRASRANYRIREFPIEWTSDRDSRLSLVRSAGRVLLELLTIRRTLRQRGGQPLT